MELWTGLAFTSSARRRWVAGSSAAGIVSISGDPAPAAGEASLGSIPVTLESGPNPKETQDWGRATGGTRGLLRHLPGNPFCFVNHGTSRQHRTGAIYEVPRARHKAGGWAWCS